MTNVLLNNVIAKTKGTILFTYTIQFKNRSSQRNSFTKRRPLKTYLNQKTQFTDIATSTHINTTSVLDLVINF